MVNEGDKITLDNTNQTIKNEQDIHNENVMNKTNIHEKYYTTQDEEPHVLD